MHLDSNSYTFNRPFLQTSSIVNCIIRIFATFFKHNLYSWQHFLTTAFSNFLCINCLEVVYIIFSTIVPRENRLNILKKENSWSRSDPFSSLSVAISHKISHLPQSLWQLANKFLICHNPCGNLLTNSSFTTQIHNLLFQFEKKAAASRISSKSDSSVTLLIWF